MRNNRTVGNKDATVSDCHNRIEDSIVSNLWTM